MLEKRRWPKSDLRHLDTCLQVLAATQPELHSLASVFFDSVKRHGYTDSAAIAHVVDDCTIAIYQAAGKEFVPDRDLVVKRPKECMIDKWPDYLPSLPVEAKLAVNRAAVRKGLGPALEWQMGRTQSGQVSVKLRDATGRQPDNLELVTNVYERPVVAFGPVGCNTSQEPPMSYDSADSELRFGPRQQISPFQQPNEFTGSQNLIVPPPAFKDVVPPQTSRSFYGTAAKDGRSYMPGLGMFISRVGWEYGFEVESPYGYAMNNPLAYVDPVGMSPISPFADSSSQKKRRPKLGCVLQQSYLRPSEPTYTSYSAVRSSVLSKLGSCGANCPSDQAQRQILATAIACIPAGESSYDLATYIYSENDRDTLYGLFQPNCYQINGCSPGENYWTVKGQVQFAINVAGYECNANGGNAYEALHGPFWKRQGSKSRVGKLYVR
jgi:hypothetical protein